MFTGIIEATAEIFQKIDSGLTVSRPKQFDDIKIGSSIAVSGVCLSVVAFDKTSMTFDVVPTTLSKTKLGSLKIGDYMNLERAMKADARFEGHIVTGHVEGVGRVVEVLGTIITFGDPRIAPTLGTPRDPLTAPTPGPSPWPSIAYAMSGKQGEGSSAMSQFSRMLGRVWKGTNECKRPPNSSLPRTGDHDARHMVGVKEP